MSDDIRNNISVPHIHDTHLDAEYGEWLESLKARYQQAKVRAVVKVNGEKLLWKWNLVVNLLCARQRNVGEAVL